MAGDRIDAQALKYLAGKDYIKRDRFQRNRFTFDVVAKSVDILRFHQTPEALRLQIQPNDIILQSAKDGREVKRAS